MGVNTSLPILFMELFVFRKLLSVTSAPIKLNHNHTTENNMEKLKNVLQ